MGRSRIYFERELYTESFADIDKAIALEPEDFNKYFVKAMAAEQAGFTDRAIAAYQDIVTHFPADSRSPYIEKYIERLQELKN